MNNRLKKAIGFAAVFAGGVLNTWSQNVHTILADSVKITGAANTAELIMQNSTKNTAGFLHNTGKGRTAFAPLLRKVNDSLYISGADSVKLATTKYVSLNKPDTIVGIKTFMPTISNAAGAAAGTVFNSSFTVQNQDTVIGADFNTVRVVNSSNTRIYSGWFYDKVLAEEEWVFQLGSTFKKTGEMLIGTWGARFDNNPITIVKPAGAFPEQFNFASRGQGTAFSNWLKTGLGFKDSVIFSNGVQDYSFMKFNPVLTQQSSASGVVRAITIHPQLTGIKDFRAIQVDVNSNNGYAIWSPGTAPAVLGGVAMYQSNYRDIMDAHTLVDKNYADSVSSGTWLRRNGTLYKTDSVYIGKKPKSTYLLSVEGTLLAKKVKVSASDIIWADYVFDSGYVPMPLTALKAYVQKNRHLPGIPSAATIEEEGLDVVQSHAAILKQIEELTLHVIRQHKQLEQHGKELKQLRAAE